MTGNLTPLKAIRQACILCMGGKDTAREPRKKIAECKNTDCPLYIFRFGKNPNWGQKQSQDQKRRLKGLARQNLGFKTPQFFGSF